MLNLRFSLSLIFKKFSKKLARNMKILVVAQGATHLSPGGAEVAAENLAVGLARIGLESHLAVAVPTSYSNSYNNLVENGVTKHFVPSNAIHPTFRNESSTSVLLWRKVVKGINPNVVHAHHFFKVGINVLSDICKFKPTVLTLHEYLAICHQDGQLLRRSGALCDEPSELECLNCNFNSLNDGGLSYIRARNESFRRFLRLPRFLVAPSKFLESKYLQWGIPQDQIHAIPNVILPPKDSFRPQLTGPTRFLYLSAITKRKGVEVLLNAAIELQKRGFSPYDLQIEIWGGGDHDYLQKVVLPVVDNSRGLVSIKRTFQRSELDYVLSRGSAVICPSIWFENRPTVLDEAIARGMPIIASNIGGMKEIASETTGMTFRFGDEFDLAESIERFVKTKPARQKIIQGFGTALTAHINLYKQII